MATNYSPRIVTDGLICCVDGGDPKSYAGSGTVWTDRVSASNNFTLNGSPAHDSTEGSFSFNNNPWAKSANTSLLTASYTKVVWFYPLSTCANIVSGGSSDGQHAFWMKNTSDTLYAGHNSSWELVSHRPNPSGDMLNQWWCGIVTFDTSVGWVLYLNGEQVDSNSATTAFTGSGAVRIAAYDDGINLFNGKIAAVQIYNRAITAAEVTQNFSAFRGRFGLT
jgi:hypothetical protein